MLKISDHSDKLFSRYLFLKTKLLRNEKIAFKLTSSNDTQLFKLCNHSSGPGVHILSAGVSKSNSNASWFICYSFCFLKGFLLTSPQKLLPLMLSLFLLRSLSIRLHQSFTVFCMCCLSGAYTTKERQPFHKFLAYYCLPCYSMEKNSVVNVILFPSLGHRNNGLRRFRPVEITPPSTSSPIERNKFVCSFQLVSLQNDLKFQGKLEDDELEMGQNLPKTE